MITRLTFKKVKISTHDKYNTIIAKNKESDILWEYKPRLYTIIKSQSIALTTIDYTFLYFVY